MMGIVRAKIQTVEDIYRLLRTAVFHKRPIHCVYDGRDRWFCPHRLGRNHQRRLRALCYQYAGQSDSGLQADGSPANWRCMLYCGREAQWSGVARRCMAHCAQPFPPTDLHCGSRRGYGRLAGSPSAAERTARQLPEQLAGQDNP